MSRANDREIVEVQYSSNKNLVARQALNTGYSTNKYGWEKWVFDQYTFKQDARVIEFGCGNGSTWHTNRNRIPRDLKIILTDLSEGMLRVAKDNTLDIKQVSDYAIVDIQDIKYKGSSIDVAIANQMLYHVPNRDLAISEVARILKTDGVFYATTNSNNNMRGFKDLVRNFDSRLDFGGFSVAKEFGLENGTDQLANYFDSVERVVYENSLHITEPKPLVDYLLSLEGHIKNLHDIMTESRIEEFTTYLKDVILSEGSIDIPKTSGMFIARKPKKVI